MKLKKISLYYREMNEYESNLGEETKPIVVFKTKEGGFGIRFQSHGWKVGDTVWTADGSQPTTVIAVANPGNLDRLLGIFQEATYIVNRFLNESERQEYLNKMENELLQAAA